MGLSNCFFFTESKLWWWWTMRREIKPTLTIWSIWLAAAFRQLNFNDLTELPPGIFDSLALLTQLYVLSLGYGDIFSCTLLVVGGKESVKHPPFPKKNHSLPRCPIFYSSFPAALGSHLVPIAFELPIHWFRPFIEQLCSQLYSVPVKRKIINRV